MVTAKDMDILQRHLFIDDCHDYKHERARVQTGSSLALFAGSGARAGAIVESSAYRHSNECLYYRVCLVLLRSAFDHHQANEFSLAHQIPGQMERRRWWLKAMGNNRFRVSEGIPLS